MPCLGVIYVYAKVEADDVSHSIPLANTAGGLRSTYVDIYKWDYVKETPAYGEYNVRWQQRCYYTSTQIIHLL